MPSLTTITSISHFNLIGPMIVFMLKHLQLSGCAFPSSSIQCHPCPETRSGGFAPEHGILLCQNRFFNKKHMEETLAHELIHAFDHCKFNVDWANLRHHACSEVGVFISFLAEAGEKNELSFASLHGFVLLAINY